METSGYQPVPNEPGGFAAVPVPTADTEATNAARTYSYVADDAAPVEADPLGRLPVEPVYDGGLPVYDLAPASEPAAADTVAEPTLVAPVVPVASYEPVQAYEAPAPAYDVAPVVELPTAELAPAYVPEQVVPATAPLEPATAPLPPAPAAFAPDGVPTEGSQSLLAESEA